MQHTPVILLMTLLAVAVLSARPQQAVERIIFAHLFEGSTAHHQEALWAAAEVEKRTNGRYAMDVLGKGTLGTSDTEMSRRVQTAREDRNLSSSGRFEKWGWRSMKSVQEGHEACL